MNIFVFLFFLIFITDKCYAEQIESGQAVQVQIHATVNNAADVDLWHEPDGTPVMIVNGEAVEYVVERETDGSFTFFAEGE